MTARQIYEMLQGVGVPCVYHHFAENSGQQPPFICYYFPASDDFKADGTNYARINELIVELYTDIKDFALEGLLGDALSENGFVYDKTEEYIDSEKMFMITYTMEVLIDG